MASCRCVNNGQAWGPGLIMLAILVDGLPMRLYVGKLGPRRLVVLAIASDGLPIS